MVPSLGSGRGPERDPFPCSDSNQAYSGSAVSDNVSTIQPSMSAHIS